MTPGWDEATRLRLQQLANGRDSTGQPFHQTWVTLDDLKAALARIGDLEAQIFHLGASWAS